MDIKEELKEISQRHINEEICGFICLDKDFYFIQTQNRSSEPNRYFYVSSMDFLKIKSENKVIAVFHNHFSTTEKESDFDRSVSENICYPMVIYSNITKKFNFYIPEYLESNVKDIERLKEILND